MKKSPYRPTRCLLKRPTPAQWRRTLERIERLAARGLKPFHIARTLQGVPGVRGGELHASTIRKILDV